jgi:hypothetical protein
VPSPPSIGRGKPRPGFAIRAPYANAADYTNRKIIPVEELAKAAFLVDAVGCWVQVDPFVLHRSPQALDEDVVVAALASIHADLDPMIPQHLGELITGELRALIGIENAGLANWARASLSASTQNPAVSVFDSRQNSTRRVASR